MAGWWAETFVIAAAQLKQLSASLTGGHSQSGGIAAHTHALGMAATAVMLPSGALTAQLPAPTAAFTAVHEQTGELAAAIPAAVSAALSGIHAQSGWVTSALLPPLTALLGAQEQHAGIAALTAPPSASLSGVMLPVGDITAQTPPLAAAFTGGQEQAGAMGATLTQTSTMILATEIQSGVVAASLAKASAVLAGLQTQSGALAAALQKAAATIAGEDIAIAGFPYTLPFPLAVGDPGLFAAIGKPSAALSGSTPAYDSNSTPVTAASIPASFNYTAAAGADVFVVITVDRSAGSITGCTYGGNAMTQVATVNHNNASASGTTKLFRATGTGSPLAVAPQGSGSAWFEVEVISLSGVNSVGTPVTATGSGTSMSQSVSGWGLHIFSAGNGGSSTGTIGSITGVTNYSNASGGSSVSQAVSIATSSGIAAATLSTATPWAAIFVPIN